MKETWSVGIKTDDGKYFSASGSKSVCEEFITSTRKMTCYQESLKLEEMANSDKKKGNHETLHHTKKTPQERQTGLVPQ